MKLENVILENVILYSALNKTYRWTRLRLDQGSRLMPLDAFLSCLLLQVFQLHVMVKVVLF